MCLYVIYFTSNSFPVLKKCLTIFFKSVCPQIATHTHTHTHAHTHTHLCTVRLRYNFILVCFQNSTIIETKYLIAKYRHRQKVKLAWRMLLTNLGSLSKFSHKYTLFLSHAHSLFPTCTYAFKCRCNEPFLHE